MTQTSSGTGASRRLFFALWPGEAASQALARLATRIALDARGRATAAERLHLTMAFVGPVPDSAVDTLVAIGAAIAGHVRAFTLTLDRVGSFRDAGIAWIGTRTPPVELLELASELKLALGSAGFRVDDRDFKAHLTLARRCERRATLQDTPAVSWRVEAMSLMASLLTPRGPQYTEIARCPLASS